MFLPIFIATALFSASLTAPTDLINPAALALALFLSIVNNRLIEYFIAPIWEKLQWAKQWLLYVTLISGIVLSLLAQVNLFAGIFPAPLPGILLTGIVIGGGANLIHDLIPGAAPAKTQ